MDVNKLLESNKILMSKIEFEIDNSNNDINNITDKQNEIKNLNKENNHYLKRITDMLYKFFTPKLLFLDNKLLENPINNNEDENLLDKSKKIGKKLDEQNEKLDELINKTENNIIDNNKNIDLIKKML